VSAASHGAGRVWARSHQSFPLTQDRPNCAGPRNFFGFMDALLPSGKRPNAAAREEKQLPVALAGTEER